ncbi:MAG: FapA family protein [Clostridiales bacterium]|nr:FapA family protein [Clostridiales bacterium]
MSYLETNEQLNRATQMLSKQEFSNDQLQEIEAGQKENLDVRVYARKEFMAIQMHQIRIGLIEGLDVSLYADPQFDWFQMEEIRLGLKAGLDVSLYADVSVPFDTMQQIRLGLEMGINLAPYKNFSAGVLKQLRLAVMHRVNLVSYIKAGYDMEQLESIRYALEKNLNLTPFLRKEYRGVSIQEICIGLEHGVNVAMYADPEYTWQQMREIRLGLEHMLDVDQYRSHFYSHQQMKEIRLGLEEGLDITYYRSLMYTASEMRERRIALKEGRVTYAREMVHADTSSSKAPEGKETDPTPEAFSIRVAPDEMEAVLEIVGPVEKISLTDISKELRRQEICNGVLYDEIDRILSGKKEPKPTIIARGVAAQDGEDGYYEYFFRTEMKRTPKILENGEADYHSLEWFETVDKGQKLAVYHSATQGVTGLTVTGRLLPAKKGKESSILVGSGFKRLADGITYVADMDGMVTLKNNQLTISKILTMDAVNLATGDVNFQGNVIVNGNVSSGASIMATGDVLIKGFVECAKITCGGNAVLYQGMNGAGSGFIRADSDVAGSFFEAVAIEAGGNIRANYFLNCNMHAREKIFVNGKKGSLAGGVAYAEEGIRANNLGNQAGLPTYVKLGSKERLENKEEAIKKQIQAIEKELQILGNAHNDYVVRYPAEVRNLMEMYLKVESALYTKEREHEEKLKTLQAIENEKRKKGYVSVIVERRLYDGVTVEIDKIRWHAENVNVMGVVLRKQDNRIVIVSNN